jgi:hypothetical protein
MECRQIHSETPMDHGHEFGHLIGANLGNGISAKNPQFDPVSVKLPETREPRQIKSHASTPPPACNGGLAARRFFPTHGIGSFQRFRS